MTNEPTLMRTEPDPAPAVWFPAIRTGAGVDVFTQRLCDKLRQRGLQAEIAWLPHRAEYLPWSVPVPQPPAWANIVHVNSWLHPRFVPTGLPVLANMHHSVHDPVLSPYKGRMQALYHRHWVHGIEAQAIEHANAVVAISEYTARQTRAIFGRGDIAVIHNGVPSPASAPELSTRQLHRPMRLLYVGNWNARKGCDLLPPIMQTLGPDYELRYTTGRSTPAPHMPGNCIHLRKLSNHELQQTFLQSDVLLFPSRLEGFGLAVAEAMSYGLPVVTTRGSSLPELVDDGHNGYLCEQDNVQDFVQAVRRLSDETVWRRLSINASRAAHTQFDESTMLDRYLAIYRSLLTRSPRHV